MFDEINLFLAENSLAVVFTIVGIVLLLPLYVIFILPGKIEKERLRLESDN